MRSRPGIETCSCRRLGGSSRGTAAEDGGRYSRLSLSITAQLGKSHVAYLRTHLLRAHAILKPKLEEMSLALVGDKVMADLHMQFMNIPGPTDVLTFPLEQDSRGRASSGEVVVCVPEATRRAKETSVTLKEELLLYALHGMLHLCGFDDRTAADFRKMHRKEDQILKAIGIGAVFHREPAAPSHKRTARPSRSRTRRAK